MLSEVIGCPFHYFWKRLLRIIPALFVPQMSILDSRSLRFCAGHYILLGFVGDYKHSNLKESSTRDAIYCCVEFGSTNQSSFGLQCHLLGALTCAHFDSRDQLFLDYAGPRWQCNIKPFQGKPSKLPVLFMNPCQNLLVSKKS
jgi:hypothetical protein